MATFTVTIPDRFIAEALAAASDINRRQREEDRQPEPLPFGETEVRSIVLDWLTNLIMSDVTQRVQVEGEREVREKRRELAELRSGE
ncbi:MAG: hypothetical protein E3J29_01945 [Dehalococcoidia bacterium]|nr:MAG: hypothetical protein E3J29_01945 [Dehalococcoidia bacterium]